MSVPQVLGPYQLKAKLAVGGQSEVWLGTRRGPGGFQRRCALKLLVPPVSYDDDARKAFIAEARLMALFDHPNLIPVTDLGEDADSAVVFAVMPYVSGTTLATIARDQQFEGLEPVEALWLMSRVLMALGFAHELKDQRRRKLDIIHRDVSPENVMIGFDGQVLLIDFGIALSTINPRNTRMHVVKGKLDFLSPEQANASPRIDQTTDIYSAGLLLYTLLTGRNPLDGDPDTALQRARNPTIPRVDSLIQVPTELAQVVHAMLSPIPADRPADARKAAHALLAIMHRMEPFYDEVAFAASIRKRLSHQIEAEENFFGGMGEGTQIIKTDGSIRVDERASRRDETTPIVAAADILERAASGDRRRGDRDSGLDETRDDLQAILAELEEIYDD